MSEFVIIIIIIILAWTYDFFNGMNDCANAIATSVSTKALPPLSAVALSATMNIAGALITTRVAKTIGKGIVNPSIIGPLVVISALIGAVIWVAFCTYSGIPISITHSLVGGIMGAVIVSHGFSALKMAGLKKVFYAMLLSPIAGFTVGFIIMIIMIRISQNAVPNKANKIFRSLQIISASFMAFSHGSNDAQNAMGIITMGLVVEGFISTFHVPIWVILGSAFFIGLGTFIGGWRVIRTMGQRMVKLEPVHGFSAETSSAAVIIFNSFIGAPISTTHIISTAIMGVGSTRKFSAVKWGVVFHIVLTWIFTIPGAAFLSALSYFLIDFWVG
ncbi:MAG: anion permease [Candidatus Aminicenantia bacterium]